MATGINKTIVDPLMIPVYDTPTQTNEGRVMKRYHVLGITLLAGLIIGAALPAKAETVANTYILKCTPEKEYTNPNPFFIQMEDTKNADRTWSRVISWDNHYNIPLDMNGDTPNDAGEIENTYLFSASDSQGMLTGPGLVITNNRKQKRTSYGETINTGPDTKQGPHGQGVCVVTDAQSKER
ncbi:hypothetical protein HZV87_004427 [Salmonella enterica]|nr:hypothetical protein [Salmonella enterica]